MIISYTIKCGSRKWRINRKNTCFFRTVEQRTPNVFWCPLNNVSATAVNDFLGVLCATFGVSCSTKCSTMWTRNFFVSLLSSIDFNVTTISCPMLRPLSCLTMLCDHNLSLVCRFNFKFSQNYINIGTDEIQR